MQRHRLAQSNRGVSSELSTSLLCVNFRPIRSRVFANEDRCSCHVEIDFHRITLLQA
jgi:hypothetical protein